MADERVCVCCRARPVDPRWSPFCSERCQVQDLARWASGDYKVPGDSIAAPDDDESEKER